MMKKTVIYLDHNATTPCAAEVIDAMLPFFIDDYANPSSTHVAGRRASRAVEKARCEIAYSYGADPGEIVFTSGATESNCMVIGGVAGHAWRRRRIVIGAGEHKSVLSPCEHLEEQGFEVMRIPLDKSGSTSIRDAEHLVNEDTILVSLQGANNETGVLQPISVIVEIAHSRGALVHCDAAQMPGKVSLCLDDLGVDYASLSAHKVYGPKGIGACYVRRGHPRAALAPLLRGGGQEGELRAGTLNVPAIVGFGVASTLAKSRLSQDRLHIQDVRNHFESRLLELLPYTVVVGATTERLPGTSCIIFPDVPADVLLARASDLCISSGSACTSGTVSPSHVVLACGYSRDEARCMVRVSFGRNSGPAEAEQAATRLYECVTTIRGDLKKRPSMKPTAAWERRHDS